MLHALVAQPDSTHRRLAAGCRRVSERTLSQSFVILVCFATLISVMSTGVARGEGSDPDLLNVIETHWGFDGSIQESTALPFSVLVQNVAPVPWEGRLRLTRSSGGGHRFGAPIELPVSLQPEERRWVQFVPYVIDVQETWILSWGEEPRHRREMASIPAGERPTVLIYDRDAVTPPGGVLRRMPEELFPTSVTATHGLRGVIFNKPPFWPGARGRAFLEWLALGGRVYILLDESGNFPQFNSPLEVLNDSRERFSVGQGHVRRIPRKVGDISLDDARREIFNDDWRAPPPAAPRVPDYGYVIAPYWVPNQDLFRELKPLTRFERRWWLIYLTALAYLAALFPGCYSIGVNRRNVRGFYLTFLGTVGLFSLSFILLGQLGASTQNRIRSVALARSLGDGSYDVTQWSSLANVNPGEYAVSHRGGGRWYSTCQDTEQVEGVLTGGSDSGVTLFMPPASTRTLRHCSRLTLENPLPKVMEFQQDASGLERVTVSIGGCFDGRVREAFFVWRDQIYDLKLERGSLVLEKEATHRVLLRDYLNRPYDWDWDFWGRSRFDDEDVSHSVRYERMLRSLAGNSFGLTREIEPRRLKLNPGTLRLFIFTTMPDEFLDTVGMFPDQQGCVLFSYDVQLGE